MKPIHLLALMTPALAIDQHERDAVGTVFENRTFTNCFRIGVFALSDSLVMRNEVNRK